MHCVQSEESLMRIAMFCRVGRTGVGLRCSSAQADEELFLMAEDLNGYFSSVFTREDISSLPVPDATFQEVKSDYLGQLSVTPEMVDKKYRQ